MFRRSTTRRHPVVVAYGLVGLLIIALTVAWGYTTTNTPAGAGKLAPGYAVPSDESLDLGAFSIPKTPRVLFVGDSFAQGAYASSPEHGYPHVVAHLMHWRHILIDANGGTGWVSDDSGLAQNFDTRVLSNRDKSFHPNVVIFEGGVDDYRLFRNHSVRLRRAVTKTLTDATRQFPGASILGVGIYSAFGNINALRPLDSLYAQTFHDAHVRYISPIAQGWITQANTTKYARPRDNHPNGNIGHRFYAECLVANLRALNGLATSDPYPVQVSLPDA